MKITDYTVRASQNQAARWMFWARLDGLQVVGRWLERLVVAKVSRKEEERGVFKAL